MTIGVGLYLFSRNKTSDEAPQTVKVEKRDLSISFSLDGALVADKYEPNFTLGGRVNRVYVKEGDSVKSGQWIATLDAEEAQKNLEKILRDYSSQRNDFEETIGVTYVNTVVTDTVKRILEKNQWDLEKSVIDVELKEIALKESRLISPVSGVVADLNLKVGDVVSTQTQTPLVTVVEPGSFTFIAYAEESDALKIEEDQIIRISLDAYDDKDYLAKSYFLSPVAEIDANGITTYKVTVYFDAPEDIKLLDGMEGSVSFVTKEVKDVMVIPNKAVYRLDNTSYVDIMEDGKEINKIEIETGFTDGKSTEVKKGLSIGQNVIIRK